MSEIDNLALEWSLPVWVPEPVRHYLAHTVGGVSIRSIARARKLHPSTILRQVRRFEVMRDDPLVDDVLRKLGAVRFGQSTDEQGNGGTMTFQDRQPVSAQDADEAQKKFEDDAFPILRRLGEPGALLALARDLETGVILRENAEGEAFRTAVVPRDIAQALALKAWIVASDPAQRIVRYVITNAGRAALRNMIARIENRAGGFRDSAAMRAMGRAEWAAPDESGGRYVAAESPLVGLARRRDKDGKPFLSPDFVQAGERLREDFELTGVTIDVASKWDQALSDANAQPTPPAMQAARDRVEAALVELGPGLSDIALCCCCLLEGLEVTEKKMGWSARSGKIVLRIALQRLVRHYDAQGKFRPLIG